MSDIRAEVGQREFAVSDYSARHRRGKAAQVWIWLATTETPDPETLRSWLGQRMTIRAKAGTSWEEIRTVTRVRTQTSRIEVLGEGPSRALDAGPDARVWADTGAVEAAEEVLRDARVEVRRHVRSARAGTRCPYLLQSYVDDRTFVKALGRTYGFAAIDRPDGTVALCDEPPGRTHTLEAHEHYAMHARHELQIATAAGAATTYEENGTFDRIEVGPAREAPARLHEGETAWRGSTPHREHLHNLAEGRADEAAIHERTTLTLAGGHFEVGDTIEGEALGGTMAIAQRRTRLETHGMESRLELVPTPQLAGELNARGPQTTPASALALGVISRPHDDENPGWCRLRLPEMKGDAEVPAQIVAPGGGMGVGQAFAPSEGATALVALVGDALMPRIVVLGICQDASNAPVSVEEAVFAIQIGAPDEGCRLQIGPDGAASLKSRTLKLAAREISMEGEEIEIVGTRALHVRSASIELARNRKR